MNLFPIGDFLTANLRHCIGSVVLLSAALAACNGSSPEQELQQARSKLDSNDPVAAAVHLKTVLAQDPSRAEARFLLGKALLESGDAKSALLELNKARQLDQPPTLVAPVQGQALLALQQYRQLIDELGSLQLTEARATADLQTSIASAHAGLGEKEAARTALAKAYAATPEFPPAQLLQAQLAAQEGRFDEALALADKVIAAEPQNAYAWARKGELLVKGKRDLAGGANALAQALKLRPSLVTARADLISLLIAKPDIKAAHENLEVLRKTRANHPQVMYFDAQLAFLEKKPKLALGLIEPALRLAPNNLQVLMLAGSIQLDAGSLAAAEQSLTKALALAPNLPVIRQLLAQTYLRQAQTNKALATIQPLLDSHRASARTYELAGQAQLRAGNFDLSADYLGNAAKLDPGNTVTRTYLAMARLKSAGNDSTVAELQSIAAADKAAFADLALVSLLISFKDFDRALKAVDNIEKKISTGTVALNLRGQIHVLKKDEAGARQYFEQALKIEPRDLQAASSLAAMDLANKQPKAAQGRIEAILAAAPNNYAALTAKAKLLALTGGSVDDITDTLTKAVAAAPNEPEARLMLVEALLAARKAKAAQDAAAEAVSVLPSNTNLLDALGRAQTSTGDFNQAVLTFKKYAALEPKAARPHLRLAGAYLAANNKPAAEQSLRRGLALAPDDVGVQNALLELLLNARRRDEAIQIARAVQRQHAAAPAGYLMEASIEERQRNFGAAAEVYRQALKKFPLPLIAIKLHTTLTAAKKESDAGQVANAWLNNNPKDTVFLAYIGDGAMLRGDYKTAETIFQKMIAIEPANAAALNNIAWVLTTLGKPGAVAYAERAAALHPEQAGLQDTLATALAADNQVAKAIDVQTRALALAPGDNVLRLNLARLYIQAGDKTAARTELSELAKLGNKFRAQAEVERLLKSL